MANLRLQKRLAADLLKCGKRRVVFAADNDQYIEQATNRSAIRELIGSKIISKREVNATSRGRIRMNARAKREGRHCGYGSRKGTREARMPSKTLWIDRQRILRRVLRRYRDAAKIDRHLYAELYQRVKGNQFKNKRVLLEHITNSKAEQKLALAAKAEQEKRRAKAAETRAARLNRIQKKRTEFAMTGVLAPKN